MGDVSGQGDTIASGDVAKHTPTVQSVDVASAETVGSSPLAVADPHTLPVVAAAVADALRHRLPPEVHEGPPASAASPRHIRTSGRTGLVGTSLPRHQYAV